MTLLEAIREPADIRPMNRTQLEELAAEIRAFLVQTVSVTGGHLGPNLGVVELTLGLHRVFDSPRDLIVWDTGHQAYVHKLLTGRRDGFARLRQDGGLSGYPCRVESEHDIVENSHASTALGYADGIAKADQLGGVSGRSVVAVVGDGALTGGMAWEALNNIAAADDRPVIIVVNDNGRSYAKTIGGFAYHLATLRVSNRYERFLEWGRDVLHRIPVAGGPVFDTLHGVKKGLKDMISPQTMFEDLGLKYLGPIDGHDIGAVEDALRRARDFGRPVIVHCLTRKGCGYQPAEEDQWDHLHTIGSANPAKPAAGTAAAAAAGTAAAQGWTSVFSEELVSLAKRRTDIVAITAAMPHPTGVHKLAEVFPERVFDVGIAEQHAVCSAAGLAFGGLHPVVAVYATFLNRAIDQVLMDVALHRAGVTFVLDRAGITGEDGPSHNGMWDLSLLQVVPGLRIACPRDAATLRAEFAEAVTVADAPTVIRFPKGAVGPDLKVLDRLGGLDVLHRSGSDVLLVAVGAMAGTCVRAAESLAARGVGVTVVDPRWVKPVDQELPRLAADYRLVSTVEDGIRTGGVGTAVGQALHDSGVDIRRCDFGIPPRFLRQGRRADLLAEAGLSASGIADALQRSLSADLSDSLVSTR